MAVIDLNNLNNNVRIDTDPKTSTSYPRNPTPSSILNSRKNVQQMSSDMLDTIKAELPSIQQQFDALQDKLKAIKNDANAAIEGTFENLAANSKELKNMENAGKAAGDVFEKINTILTKGNASAQELVDTYTQLLDSRLDMAHTEAKLNQTYDLQNKKIKEQNAEMQKSSKLSDTMYKDQKNKIQEQKAKFEKEMANMNKNLSSAFSSALDKAANTLRDIKQTFDINKLVEMNGAQSSRVKLQESLMNAYGINRSQFSQFKNNVAGSFNTSLYTTDEVMQVYSSLQEIGIGNQERAEKYFSEILRGQSLLGMTAETQRSLMQLSVTTGKDQLKFATNSIAQYLKTATNLSKDQLNELVAINTNTSQELANYGITSAESAQTLNDVTVALENATSGGQIGDSYRAALSSLNSTDNLAFNLGMDWEEYLRRSNAGENLFDMIRTSGGMLGKMYQVAASGNMDEFNHLRESSGIDASQANFIQQWAQLEKSTGKSIDNILQTTENVDENSDDELMTLEELRDSNMDFTQKFSNFIGNFALTKMDWVTIDTISNSLQMIISILSAIQATTALSGLFGGGSSLENIANAKGFKGKLSAVGQAAGKIFAPIAIASSVYGGLQGWNTADQYYQYQDGGANFGQKLMWTATSAIGGSNVSYDSQGKVDTGKTYLSSIGSGALTGAAIGSIIPVIGTGLGAVIGGIGGLVSGWWKSSEAKKQEEELKKQTEQLEQINENTNTTASRVRDLSTITAAGRLVPAYVAKQQDIGTGGGSRGPVFRSYAPDHSSSSSLMSHIGGWSGNKGDMFGPWLVSSMYGPRKLNGKDDYHYGIDLAANGTQEVYAAHPGKVVYINDGLRSGYGPYAVKVVNGNTSYIYGHLKARYPAEGSYVTAGTHLGTMGDLGNSFGQHLHYEVRVGSDRVNPMPYMETSLFDGTSSTSTNTSTNELSTATEAPTQTSFTYKLRNNIGGSDAVVAGLAQINQTLIDLANRQTQNEEIMSMLLNKNQVSPIF